MNGTLMNRGIRNELILASLMVFGGIALLNARPAFSAPRELSGEVVRVNPAKKQVVLKIDDKRGRPQEVDIRIKSGAALEGTADLASLEKGAAVRVHAENRPLTRVWVATRLTVVESEGARGMNQVERADLHDLEQQAAHGKISEGQFESRRRTLEPSAAKVEF